MSTKSGYVVCLMWQLFKGMMYYCDGDDVSDVDTKIDCINKGIGYHWVNQKYNFDNLGQASLMIHMYVYIV